MAINYKQFPLNHSFDYDQPAPADQKPPSNDNLDVNMYVFKDNEQEREYIVFHGEDGLSAVERHMKKDDEEMPYKIERKRDDSGQFYLYAHGKGGVSLTMIPKQPDISDLAGFPTPFIERTTGKATLILYTIVTPVGISTVQLFNSKGHAIDYQDNDDKSINARYGRLSSFGGLQNASGNPKWEDSPGEVAKLPISPTSKLSTFSISQDDIKSGKYPVVYIDDIESEETKDGQERHDE